MRNFGKVIRVALHYPFSIVAAFLCSLAVGVLWGGNIAALYPFVEVVFRGESFHGWMERRVTTGEETCTSLTKSIGDLEQKLAQIPDAQRAELTDNLPWNVPAWRPKKRASFARAGARIWCAAISPTIHSRTWCW